MPELAGTAQICYLLILNYFELIPSLVVLIISLFTLGRGIPPLSLQTGSTLECSLSTSTLFAVLQHWELQLCLLCSGRALLPDRAFSWSSGASESLVLGWFIWRTVRFLFRGRGCSCSAPRTAQFSRMSTRWQHGVWNGHELLFGFCAGKVWVNLSSANPFLTWCLYTNS